MAAVLVPDSHAENYRSTLRGFLRPGQRRLHWREEGDRRRSLLIAALAETRPSGIVVVGENLVPRRQERARRKCIERLLWKLGQRAIVEVMFERRHEELDKRDREMIEALRQRRAMPADLQVSWGNPDLEPLLWIPDIVAGAVSLAETGQEKYWKELGSGLMVDRFPIT